MKFKQETEFQETEIGKIPRGWKVVYLSELFEFHRGLSYRKNNLSPTQTSIRFVTINDLKKEGGWKREGESAYLSEGFKDKIEKKHVLKVGDLLIAITDMGKGFIIGAPLYINEDIRSQGETLVYSMDLVKLQPKKQVNTLFYFYQLSWSKIREIMKSLARGTNVLHLDLNLAQRIKLVDPPLNEQVRIAEILSIVDRAIELYHEERTRLDHLKRGLMDLLLTGRIRVREENGKTAFYRETEFQDTEIGKIPREWKVVKLKNVAMEIRSGFASGKRDETDGIIHLRMFNIGLDGMLSFDEIVKVPKPRDWRLYLLRHGDILLVNTSGSEEHIGKVAIFENVELECTYSNHLTRIRIDENEVDSRWVYFVLYYLWQTGYFKSLVHQQAGGQRNIPLKAIENLPITLPPTNEARKIAEFLSMINAVIKLYREERTRLDHLKRGLMDLLLTGRVRVVEE